MVSQFILALLLGLLTGASGVRPHAHLIIQDEAREVLQVSRGSMTPEAEKDSTLAVVGKDNTPVEAQTLTWKGKIPAEIEQEAARAKVKQELRKAHPAGSDFHELVSQITSDQSQFRQVALMRSDEMKSFVRQHPTEGFNAFRLLAADENWQVRYFAVLSPAWPELFQQKGTEAWQIFEKFFNDSSLEGMRQMRRGLAASPAWLDLFRQNGAEAWRIFNELATDSPGVKQEAAVSPAWPEAFQEDGAKAFQLFKQLTIDEHRIVMRAAVASPTWLEAFKHNGADAFDLFKKLATRCLDYLDERKAAVLSQAWPPALQQNGAETWRLFKLLVTDDHDKPTKPLPHSVWPVAFHGNRSLSFVWILASNKTLEVRDVAPASPAWPEALQQNGTEAWPLFKSLANSTRALRRSVAAQFTPWPEAFKNNEMEALWLFKQLSTDKDWEVRVLTDQRSEAAWPSLNNISLPQNDDVAQILQVAGDLQAIANSGYGDKVQRTKMLQEIVAIVNKSHDHEFLGKMAEYPITPAARRLVEMAEKSEHDALVLLGFAARLTGFLFASAAYHTCCILEL